MLMMTADDFDKLANSKAQLLRDEIAAKLTAEAEAHPKWEVHDLLTRLAKEIKEGATK